MISEFLSILEMIRARNETLRIGEILQGASDRAKMRKNCNLFDLSDKELLKSLKDYLEALQ